MTKRRLAARDIFSIELVGDNAKHPTKPKTAVVVERLLEDENTYQSHIWMVSTKDGSKTLFTNSNKSETAPAWSPDGRFLAFLSNRTGDKMQIHVMSEAGGEAVVVTDVPEGVRSFYWSPDGTRIGFIANVSDEEMSKQAEAAQAEAAQTDAKDAKEDPREKYTKDVQHITRSFYRLDGVGFFGDRRAHLFLVDVSSLVNNHYHVPAHGEKLVQQFPRLQITLGEYDVDSFDFSPDGKQAVIATNVNEDSERTFRQFLYLLDLPATFASGSEIQTPAMHCLTPQFHTAAKPKFSPDGRLIAFKGENHQHGPTTLTGLYLYDFDSKQVTWLTRNQDELFENRSIADTRAGTSDALVWSADGQGLYTLLSKRGRVQVVRVDAASGDAQYLTHGDHCVLSYSLDKEDTELVLTVGTAMDPANVYVQPLMQTALGETVGVRSGDSFPFGSELQMRQLTAWNQGFLDSVELSSPKRFEFESDGLTLDGWIMLPLQEAPPEGHPAVLEVHGGPATMYSDSFFFEFQLLAAEGMAVVYSNPRGSIGYGQEFCSCIEMDWGDLDFKDVEKLMDTALERYSLNPKKLAIAGGSYGGFMSAWAIGHTKRYRAAVVMRAVINWYSMMASDIGYATPAEEFGNAAPWDDPERYMRISPITYVGNVDTSTLIIHSENDFRCPIDQGEQFYIALKLRGVPVEFLRFPGESHGLSRNGKPWHRIVRLEKMAAFLNRELRL